MSNRGRLTLSLFLVLASEALAQTTLQVKVYDYASLKPATLQEFVARIHRILAGSGLSVYVESCARGVEESCKTPTGVATTLVIRVIAGTARKMSNVRQSPLGQSFADAEGGTFASVFLAPAQDQAAEANVPWVVVLAYAAAHEIGHLLLGNRAHTPRGLMKAKWDGNDFQAMNQNSCHFSSEQIRELTKRYGVSGRADQGTDAALTSPR